VLVHSTANLTGVTDLDRYARRVVHREVTERLGPVGNTPASYSGGPGFKFRDGDRLSLLRFFRSFSQSLQANAGIVLKITHRPLPSTSVQIHYSSVIVSLNAITEKRRQTN
jgi:hypothetical protein